MARAVHVVRGIGRSGPVPLESGQRSPGPESSAHFSPGEIILKVDDSRVVTNAYPLDPEKGQFEHHCDYLAGSKVVLMQPPERFINHRCDPNTFIRTVSRDRYVVAPREIRPADEITYDYCVIRDGDTAWDCSYKSPECRKRHLSGFFHLPSDVQARYLPLLLILTGMAILNAVLLWPLQTELGIGDVGPPDRERSRPAAPFLVET